MMQSGLAVTQYTRQSLSAEWQELRRITSESEGVDTSQEDINLQMFKIVSKIITGLQQHDVSILSNYHEASQSVSRLAANMPKASERTDYDKRTQKVTDSKAAMSLKTFSGKEDFKEWITKVINVFSVVHKESREYFKQVTKQMNAADSYLEKRRAEVAKGGSPAASP